MHLAPRNPQFLHHEPHAKVANVREVVFGLEDGMVSTLGALTGIAVGSGDAAAVILAGVAIIAVESVSMGIGSYISNESEEKISERMIAEEKEEIAEHPRYEKKEMYELFVADGWPPELATRMTEAAAADKGLMLREMAYRELKVSPERPPRPSVSGVAMFFAYMAGGVVPLAPYFFAPLGGALLVSIPATLAGLFGLGVFVSRYTKEGWLKAGGHFLLFGGVALLVGFLVGTFADTLS